MPTSPASLQRRVRHAADVLDAYKKAAGCADCGFNAWPEALQFDHEDPRTKLRALGWYDDRSKLKSRAKLQGFLRHVQLYCTVRCANCHAHRTKLAGHYYMGKQRNEPAFETLF
ncbi:hypothetical protein [Microbacterium esteraromaticum]|uniref:hypothetical protein n=1 Tax=Microbacterium esteraromaticum TaxID=57043 RepID=UPI0015F47FDB|nr:hypothetical protein [Microbacterium esteraromaticum]